MKDILSIYKFKTPFFNLEKEKDTINGLKNKIKIFFKSFGVDCSENIDFSGLYKNIKFYSQEGIMVLLGFNKEYNQNFMPIMYIILFVDESILNKIDINNLGQLLLEILPELNENDILLDANFDFKYNQNILNINDLIKKYKNIDEISKIIENFIKQNNKNDFLKIKEVFLLFNALLFENYKNIIKAKKTLEENKKVYKENTDNKVLLEHLKLSNIRLERQLNLNIEIFTKYTIMLEKFYKIF